MIIAMRLVAERMKLLVEAAAGAAVAAALKLKQEQAFKDCKLERVAVILCGGNVDFDKLPWV